MNLANVTKRLERFERYLTHRYPEQPITREPRMNGDSAAWLGQLQRLSEDVYRIKQKAEGVGDDRVALAAIGELRRIAELSARLCGQLDAETGVNVVHVELKPETAERMARTYLARHPTLEPSQ